MPPLSSHLSHRIAHRLGWNRGTVVAATDRRGIVWVGFRCATCGEVSQVAPARGADEIRSGVQPPDEAFT